MNQSMDWCLSRKEDGTFSAYALYRRADARVMLPLVRYATPPYVLWIDRLQLQDESLRETLVRIDDRSRSIYLKFEEFYGVPTADDSACPDPR